MLSEQKPADLGDAQWLQIPADASSVVVREYLGDRASEQLAELDIVPLDPDPVAALTDNALSEQLTAMAWTLMKLATLHAPSSPSSSTAEHPADSPSRDLGTLTRHRTICT